MKDEFLSKQAVIKLWEEISSNYLQQYPFTAFKNVTKLKEVATTQSTLALFASKDACQTLDIDYATDFKAELEQALEKICETHRARQIKQLIFDLQKNSTALLDGLYENIISISTRDPDFIAAMVTAIKSNLALLNFAHLDLEKVSRLIKIADNFQLEIVGSDGFLLKNILTDKLFAAFDAFFSLTKISLFTNPFAKPVVKQSESHAFSFSSIGTGLKKVFNYVTDTLKNCCGRQTSALPSEDNTFSSNSCGSSLGDFLDYILKMLEDCRLQSSALNGMFAALLVDIFSKINSLSSDDIAKECNNGTECKVVLINFLCYSLQKHLDFIGDNEATNVFSRLQSIMLEILLNADKKNVYYLDISAFCECLLYLYNFSEKSGFRIPPTTIERLFNNLFAIRIYCNSFEKILSVIKKYASIVPKALHSKVFDHLIKCFEYLIEYNQEYSICFDYSSCLEVFAKICSNFSHNETFATLQARLNKKLSTYINFLVAQNSRELHIKQRLVLLESISKNYLTKPCFAEQLVLVGKEIAKQTSSPNYRVYLQNYVYLQNAYTVLSDPKESKATSVTLPDAKISAVEPSVQSDLAVCKAAILAHSLTQVLMSCNQSNAATDCAKTISTNITPQQQWGLV